MKKNLKNILAIAVLSTVMVSCSKEDKLDSQSYFSDNETSAPNEVDIYLKKTFTVPYNIDVQYRWDRNSYGPGKDILRNLYPAKLSSVKPAFEMVDKVWIQSYEEVAGKHFLELIRPGKFLLAGGPAMNDDGTKTLGLASGGVQVTLYEADYLGKDVASARQFIHTIQHEYIHIINQNKDFNEVDYGVKNRGYYTTNWMDINSTLFNDRGQLYKDADGKPWTIESYANVIGFITAYSRSNTFEDFAEVASYLLSHTPQEYEALLTSIKRYDNMTIQQRASLGLTEANYVSGGAEKIEYKRQFVIDYFKSKFNIDFNELARVANKNAAESPMLNRGTSSRATFGIQDVKTGLNNSKIVRFCQSHQTVLSNSKSVK